MKNKKAMHNYDALNEINTDGKEKRAKKKRKGYKFLVYEAGKRIYHEFDKHIS